MGKRGRRRERECRETLGPPVNVEVIAPVDLKGLAALIKPALLYADRVVVHSPAASLLHGVTQFTEFSEPVDQLAAIVTVARQVPSVLPLNFDPAAIEGFEALLRLPPDVARAIGRAEGVESEINDLLTGIEDLRRMWEEEMPRVTEQVVAEVGAEELLEAIRRGVVEVGPLASRSPADHVADAVAAASGQRKGRVLDPIFDDFLETVIEVVSDSAGFPLLDADASGLVRAMESESILAFTGNAVSRSAEVDAATRFMAFLPYFPDLPLSEVLDLRQSLTGPLGRFRGDMVRLSKEFSRPADDDFPAGVADAWRERVAPALDEIRESLAEHGFLREVESIVLGDVRRMLSEAGGVLAASHTNLLDLSAIVTLGAAVGVPALDTAGRAVKETMAARRGARNQGFYFLHKLDEQSRKRT